MNRIVLPDGRAAYDISTLAILVAPDGIFLKDYPEHIILVQTRNTLYTLISRDGGLEGKASKESGTPKYLAEHTTGLTLVGSTWGGSAIKVGYIGVGMRLELYIPGHRGNVVTSPIVNIRICKLVTVCS